MPTLQIKRGAVSGLPSLAAGQPGFTTDQFRLYVGSSGGNRLVGLLDNIAGTTAPTVNEDAGDGYSVGSVWTDTTNDKSYICSDSTVGAALWQQFSGTGSGGGVTTTGSPASGNLTKFSGASSVTNGDLSGDVTTSGTLATTIANNAVTLAKLATQAADTVLANATTGSAVPTAVAVSASQFVGRTASSRVKGMSATEATALLNSFVAAGGGHLPGVVPDPGATSYAQHPKILGTQASWITHSGKIIAGTWVTTQESTTSTTYVDLTTVQSYGFTLDVATDVVIFAACGYLNTGGTNPIGIICADIDGTDTAICATSAINTSSLQNMSGAITATLAAGAHTIKLQFRVTAGTGFFSDRTMMISLKA